MKDHSIPLAVKVNAYVWDDREDYSAAAAFANIWRATDYVARLGTEGRYDRITLTDAHGDVHNFDKYGIKT